MGWILGLYRFTRQWVGPQWVDENGPTDNPADANSVHAERLYQSKALDGRRRVYSSVSMTLSERQSVTSSQCVASTVSFPLKFSTYSLQ